MIFLLSCAKRAKLITTLTSSAMTKDHYTMFTLPVWLNSHAAGISTTS